MLNKNKPSALRAKYTHHTNFVYALRISPCREQTADRRIGSYTGAYAPTHNKVGESWGRRMLIGRHSFIRQSKLSNVAGRIDYISNPKRQEYLYATYQTEGATPEFWKNLAIENQLDFKASGSAGKCIEGREFIIALPESFVQYRSGDVVRIFTEDFS